MTLEPMVPTMAPMPKAQVSILGSQAAMSIGLPCATSLSQASAGAIVGDTASLRR